MPQRRAAASRRAAALDESTTTLTLEISEPARDLAENLRFIAEKTLDIEAIVDAYRRLYAANRDFTVTPELLFELKDLTKSVDDRELTEELSRRVRRSLKGLAAISSVAHVAADEPACNDGLRIVANGSSPNSPEDGLLVRERAS